MNALLLFVATVAAFALAFMDGANNAANSIGVAIGGGLMGLREALVLAAVFDLVGGLLYGGFSSPTLFKGVVNPVGMGSNVLATGMTVVLLSSALVVYAATRAKIPVSVTQCVVGSLVGLGLALGGRRVAWDTVAALAVAWSAVPAASTALAFVEYRLMEEATRRLGEPGHLLAGSALAGATVAMASYFALTGIPAIGWALALALSVGASAAVAAAFHSYARKWSGGERYRLYRLLLAFSSASIALAHGGNDVANPSGPLAGVIYAEAYGAMGSERVEVPLPIIALSSLGIAAGVLTWGYSVVETVGERIVALTPESAFVAQFSASQVVLTTVRLGLPTSITGAVVGSVAGVGLARGTRNVNAKVLARIAATWAASIVAGMALSFAAIKAYLALSLP
ncbi:MAG: inorganic phosphate transporter [Desulfurococcaceae archaeon]